MSVIYIKTAETAVDIKKYAEVGKMLKGPFLHNIATVLLDNDQMVTGYIKQMNLSNPTLSTYSGYIALITENHETVVIDLLNIKFVKGVSQEIADRFVKKGIIIELSDEEHQEFLKKGVFP